MLTCADIMTPTPACHEPATMIDEVARTMAACEVGPIPVVESAASMRLVGMVTDRDITVKSVAQGLDPTSTAVDEIMTKNPVTCTPGDEIRKAIQLMEQCQLRRIPIVDESGRLVGIISQADIATRLHDSAQTAEVVEEISKSPP